jgi:hypothetical protein
MNYITFTGHVLYSLIVAHFANYRLHDGALENLVVSLVMWWKNSQFYITFTVGQESQGQQKIMYIISAPNRQDV